MNQAARTALMRSIVSRQSKVRTPTYRSWDGIIQRCKNPRCKKYKIYGGRGILVCERWRSFANFLADMGTRPDGMSIDRIDNGGNYEPGNCRWATAKTQARNTRSTKLCSLSAVLMRYFVARGEIQHDIAYAFGVTQSSVWAVLERRTWDSALDDLAVPL